MLEPFGQGVAGKDLIRAAGRAFPVDKANHEIHRSSEAETTSRVITTGIWVMALALVLPTIALRTASSPIVAFELHPTLKVPALGFLITIGRALIAGGLGAHVATDLIYAAMVFSVLIGPINKATVAAPGPRTCAILRDPRSRSSIASIARTRGHPHIKGGRHA